MGWARGENPYIVLHTPVRDGVVASLKDYLSGVLGAVTWAPPWGHDLSWSGTRMERVQRPRRPTMQSSMRGARKGPMPGRRSHGAALGAGEVAHGGRLLVHFEGDGIVGRGAGSFRAAGDSVRGGSPGWRRRRLERLGWRRAVGRRRRRARWHNRQRQRLSCGLQRCRQL